MGLSELSALTADSKLVSLVVPVFNEDASIEPFLAELRAVMESARTRFDGRVGFEIIFVNDGSDDRTLATILAAQKSDSRIRALDFSRNFGKEAALTAGIQDARGDAVIPIDVDLQDPPELIVEMIEKWLAGALVVLARRTDRSEDSLLKRQTANWFYSLHNLISQTRIPANVGDFRLMDRVVVNVLNRLPENRRFMKGLYAWVGFEPVYIDYKRRSREAGASKFSGWRLWRFALEGITSFSDVPLVVWTYIGLAVSTLSLVYSIVIATKALILGIDVPGYASTMSAVLFLGGIQLLGIGILGEYIGRIYWEVKGRPTYVIGKRYDGEAPGDKP